MITLLKRKLQWLLIRDKADFVAKNVIRDIRRSSHQKVIAILNIYVLITELQNT